MSIASGPLIYFGMAWNDAGSDVRAGHRCVGRLDQFRRAPAQCRPGRRGVGDDVQAAGVRVERHRAHASGELGHGCGKDGAEPGEDASACGGATMPRSTTEAGWPL
ncbi:hypothetical protein ACGFZA_42065 [Streptomyces sp. NPDC048211]|uniref:hypothetical protein n=1 Tax=Streptomyces sp. NPDC048211 TaxID=3365516 RepID=UPI00371ACD50